MSSMRQDSTRQSRLSSHTPHTFFIVILEKNSAGMEWTIDSRLIIGMCARTGSQSKTRQTQVCMHAIHGTTQTHMSFTVFLDLPAPWDAVDHAKLSLRVRYYPTSCHFRFSLRDSNPHLFFSFHLSVGLTHSPSNLRSRTYHEILFDRKTAILAFAASVHASNRSSAP